MDKDGKKTIAALEKISSDLATQEIGPIGSPPGAAALLPMMQSVGKAGH